MSLLYWSDFWGSLHIFKMFRFWVKKGCFDKIFESTVLKLFEEKMLDTSVMHGDGTSTAAKKGEII